MAAPRFHTLTISDLRRETADAVSLAFAVPDRLREAYRYTPGQYLTLRATIDGEDVRRSYSICSGLDDGELRVVIKRVEGGAFSGWANEQLHAGDKLAVMTPDGRFGVPIEPGAARTLVAFAAGSGITPVMAILKTVLHAGGRALLPVLRQSHHRQHHHARAVGGPEGPLSCALLGVPCAVARAAGYRRAQRPPRCGEAATADAHDGADRNRWTTRSSVARSR